MHPRFVEIPVSLLQDPTLNTLLTEFVTRQGMEDSIEEDIADWIAQLKHQLQQGELIIVHDIDTETTEVMTFRQAQPFLGSQKH